MSVLGSVSDSRSLRRPLPVYLQVGVAALGTVVLLWGVYGLVFVFGTMPRSESGFAEGLALIIYGLYTLAGFTVLSGGLLIPQREGSGIQFSPRQRRLLGYAVIAPVASLIAIPVWAQLGSALGDIGELVLGVGILVLLASGPLATLLAVGAKLYSAWR